MKKFLALLMCLLIGLTSMGIVGCGGGSGGKVTEIYVFTANGGTGAQYLRNLEIRFESAFEGKSYAPGKEGVDVIVDENLSDPMAALASNGNNVLFVKKSASVEYAATGAIMPITDWVTELSEDTRNGEKVSIADKIPEDQLKWHTYNDEIYALPGEQYMESGIFFDVELWDEFGLWLAPADATNYYLPYTAQPYVESLGENASIKLIAYEDAPRSLGPDGQGGTEDDGLPSSVTEFIVLCHYMKNQCGISPFSCSGAYPGYGQCFVNGLWKSIAGQTYSALYNMDTECEIVTGVSETEYIFKTDKVAVPKPITQWVDVTEETGYLARSMSARYYANALLEILFKEGFMATSTTFVNTVTHVMAQSAFISSGQEVGGNKAETIAMHTDGTYWWNESTQEGNFEKWYRFYDGEDKAQRRKDGQDRGITYMSLPVKWDGSVVDENDPAAHESYGSMFAAGMMVVNANVLQDKNREELLAAIKDFVQFAYTDESLNEFTRNTGMVYNLDYEIKEDVYNHISAYSKKMIKVMRNPVAPFNFNQTYYRYPGNFNYSSLGPFCGVGRYSNFLAALKEIPNEATTWAEFQEGVVSQEVWMSTYYQGDKA